MVIFLPVFNLGFDMRLTTAKPELLVEKTQSPLILFVCTLFTSHLLVQSNAITNCITILTFAGQGPIDHANKLLLAYSKLVNLTKGKFCALKRIIMSANTNNLANYRIDS